MTQTNQPDLIGIADVAAKIPAFISKVPNLLNGLRQAYLRTPNTPAGLGLAFEKQHSVILKVLHYVLRISPIPMLT